MNLVEKSQTGRMENWDEKLIYKGPTGCQIVASRGDVTTFEEV